MASIPYSILLTQKENVLPMSTIQEHQKFCRKFLKVHQAFEKYNNNSKNKLILTNDNVYFFSRKKQTQKDILAWFKSLPIEEKLTILSIKNKWLVNIFSQMFYIYYKMGNYSYKPLQEMYIFFDDQRKYLSRSESGNSLKPLYEILESKNISFNPSSKKDSSNTNNKEENEYSYDEFNLYSNYFEMKEIIDKDYIHSEKREYEKNFIQNIRVISSEKGIYDTITFTKDFITNIDEIKKYLDYFTGENYFKNWLMPINAKNVYNFILPCWMQNNEELSLCQLIIGFFEQKIMLNYEYYYYTKKIYDMTYDKQINELYNENIELEEFINNNYSINNNNKDKEEILTSEKIIQIVDELRGEEGFHKKISLKKNIFNKICSGKSFYMGKEISFNDELSLEIYNYLHEEILKENEDNCISKMLELITFIRFIDIIDLKEDIFYEFRKSIINSKEKSVLDELQSEGFLQKKNGKKHKKKKKKNENQNTNNKSNKIEEKKNQNIIRISQPVKIQTKECECEYNMNSRNPKFNMIQENAADIYIDSFVKSNDHLFIQGTKKKEDKEEEKQNEKKEKDKSEKKKEEKTDNNILEIKDQKKIEIKKEINKDNNEIKKEEKEIKMEDNKEVINESKKEIKGKGKEKEFFLYPINKKKKKDNNLNSINEIKETKEKYNNHKNKKKDLKEDEKEILPKKNNIFNYVQERKNNVQINPCPRRKKKMPFETSSIRFEMCMPPLDSSYPYYYSFPMMKPFTSLSEVSTKFSMPSQKSNNHKNKQNNTTNKNNDKSNSINNKKSHWDNSQYNSNQDNIFQLFNFFVPSEKYFDSLNKELNNYLSVTNSNITNLINLYQENLQKIELLIQKGLSENYEIKFGHYGSFFSNLSIEGSDLDILIYYHKKKEENDFYKDVLNLLSQNENEFESICPILTASVPVIKLEINIKNEIKDLKLKTTSYFEEEDLSKIKIDLTFTEIEQDFQHSNAVVSYINKSLIDYPLIKPILLLLKRYFKEMKMNKSYTGGLCSYSLFLLVLSFCKCNKQCESPTKLLYYFMENFMYFDYNNYCIDVEKDNCYILKDKKEYNTEKSVSDENSSYETNYENEKEEIYIVDPLSKNNVSKSSFKVDEIILTFRKAFNLLYYEGWYFDYISSNNKNENRIVENANEFYEDNSSDYMTIKKLFNLKSLRNNFDFYFN